MGGRGREAVDEPVPSLGDSVLHALSEPSATETVYLRPFLVDSSLHVLKE